MPTILIIDDDIDLRKMLVRLLERENYMILEAESGIEALSLLDHSIPDLIITDIIMPDQDGIGTINSVRKLHPDIKIIAISGGGRMLSQDYLRIAEILGAHYTFPKPFDNRELLEKIKELIDSGTQES
jgi:CheY-like chemotaxis protein